MSGKRKKIFNFHYRNLCPTHNQSPANLFAHWIAPASFIIIIVSYFLSFVIVTDNNFPVVFFFFNDTATTEIYTLSYTLSLHDALPIWYLVELEPHAVGAVAGYRHVGIGLLAAFAVLESDILHVRCEAHRSTFVEHILAGRPRRDFRRYRPGVGLMVSSAGGHAEHQGQSNE